MHQPWERVCLRHLSYLVTSEEKVKNKTRIKLFKDIKVENLHSPEQFFFFFFLANFLESPIVWLELGVNEVSHSGDWLDSAGSQ